MVDDVVATGPSLLQDPSIDDAPSMFMFVTWESDCVFRAISIAA